MRTYTIEVNEEQAEIIKEALEFYARIKIGQWNELSTLCLDLRDKEYREKKEAIDNGIFELRKIAYPDLHGRMESYGIAHNKESCLAWDIYQVLRHSISCARHPEGGWTTDFQEPMSFSGKPLAKCTVEEKE